MMVTALATFSVGVFTSIALLTKHEHWELDKAEVHPLADALHKAIGTLPVKHYDFITQILEKWTPWIHLAFVGAALVLPRIEDSIKLYEKGKQPFKPAQRAPDGAGQGSDSGNAATENDTFNFPSSLGWDNR